MRWICNEESHSLQQRTVLHCCALESWAAKKAQICFESKCKKALITTWSSPHTVLLHAILGSTIQFLQLLSKHCTLHSGEQSTVAALHLSLPLQNWPPCPASANIFPLKDKPDYEACITIKKFEASEPNNHEKKIWIKIDKKSERLLTTNSNCGAAANFPFDTGASRINNQLN